METSSTPVPKESFFRIELFTSSTSLIVFIIFRAVDNPSNDTTVDRKWSLSRIGTMADKCHKLIFAENRMVIAER